MTATDLPLACCEASLLAYHRKTWSAGNCEALAYSLHGPAGPLYGIAFRGTDNLADAGIDLMAFPRRHPKLGWVHTGFAGGPDAIHPKIAADLPDKGAPLCLAGHSKGGPEATFEAALLVLDGHNVKFLIVFNPPRSTMGTRVLEILGIAGVIMLRIVARGDPVSHLPPWLMGYSHFIAPGYVGQGWDAAPDHPLLAVYMDMIQDRLAGGTLAAGRAAAKLAWARDLGPNSPPAPA